MAAESGKPHQYFIEEIRGLSDEVILTVMRTWLHEREEQYREKFKRP
ncbi:MAG TPA: hypothetical protein VLJ21_04310 [Candidatus Binatia bacterium]|nr:hypothetical protein [Candidatus Binatia bacterium]